MNTNKRTNKFIRFMQNNIALLIIILCVVAIATIVLVVALEDNAPDVPVGGTNKPPVTTNTPNVPDDDKPNDDKPNDDKPDDDKPAVVKVYYASPVVDATVGMGFTCEETMFVFNQTLNAWRTHKALDLIATDGADVTAMHSGTVVEVDNTYSMGESVTIDHGNNVVATYASLANVEVVEGQTVALGDKLGTVSVTANNEFMEGAHLHLEVSVDDVLVDPTPYVDGTMYKEVQQ